MSLTRNAKLIIAVLVIVILVGGAYIAGQSGSTVEKFLTWLDGVGVSELTGSDFIIFEGDQNGGSLYKLRGNALTPINLLITTGDVIDYVRTPDQNTEAFIFQTEEALGSRVSVKKKGEANVLFGNPSTIKSGLAISPDGTQIAYAELKEPAQAANYTPNVSEWVVRVIDIATNRNSSLGEGVAPYFAAISETGEANAIIYSSPKGLVIHSLETFEQTVFSEFRTADIDQAAVVAVNGRYFAFFNAVTGTYALFDLYQTNPVRFSALGGLRHKYESIALLNTEIVGLSDISGVKRLFSIQYGNLNVREEVFVFSDTINPTRLIPCNHFLSTFF